MIWTARAAAGMASTATIKRSGFIAWEGTASPVSDPPASLKSMESYLETVQAHLLALRGSGLTLSPVESDVIRAWRDRGVPLELELLGLEQAHRAHVGAGRAPRVRPVSLRRADECVEELFEAY